MATKSGVLAIASYPAVVGAVLSRLRKDRPLSQTHMAEAVGVTVSTWSRIESGESGLSIEQLALAAVKLGVEPSAILKAADEKVAELRKRGVQTQPGRDSIATIIGSGALPIVGAPLLSLLGHVAVGAVVSGFKLLEEKKKAKG